MMFKKDKKDKLIREENLASLVIIPVFLCLFLLLYVGKSVPFRSKNRLNSQSYSIGIQKLYIKCVTMTTNIKWINHIYYIGILSLIVYRYFTWRLTYQFVVKLTQSINFHASLLLILQNRGMLCRCSRNPNHDVGENKVFLLNTKLLSTFQWM